MKRILLCKMALLFMLSHAIYADPIKTIRFATEATYPPFEFIDESGQMRGFDIDIANALCKKIHAECIFNNQSFNSLIPSLQLGKFDALISALGVTVERQKQVAFTHSYYEPSGSFVAATSKHYTISNLTDKTIGVQQSSTFEKYLHDKFGKKITMKSYASIQDAFLDLVSGRIDEVLADTPIAQAWLKQAGNNERYSIVNQPIIDPTYFGAGYAIAVRNDETDLLNALNEALTEIKNDGTYANIKQHYFGK